MPFRDIHLKGFLLSMKWSHFKQKIQQHGWQNHGEKENYKKNCLIVRKHITFTLVHFTMFFFSFILNFLVFFIWKTEEEIKTNRKTKLPRADVTQKNRIFKLITVPSMLLNTAVTSTRAKTKKRDKTKQMPGNVRQWNQAVYAWFPRFTFFPR